MKLARILCLALSVAGTSVSAGTVPASGSLDFDVVRKGKDIGDHSYRFSGTSDALTVTVRTDIAVKVPIIGVNAYHFNHASTEQWKGATLRAISAETDDDGTPHSLNAGASKLLPASLWNIDTVKSSQLLNTIDGHVMRVNVQHIGPEKVTTARGPIVAEHYRLSGDLTRDLWYDQNGSLAYVSFTAEDGSTVLYIRK